MTDNSTTKDDDDEDVPQAQEVTLGEVSQSTPGESDDESGDNNSESQTEHEPSDAEQLSSDHQTGGSVEERSPGDEIADETTGELSETDETTAAAAETIPADAQEVTESPDDRSGQNASIHPNTARGKWLLFGVGGCGNKLIDAIHLRRRTLQGENDALAAIWQSGIEGTISTNTNRTELRESYYAKEVYDGSPDRFAGVNKFPGDGAGVNEAIGHQLAEEGFDDRQMYARWLSTMDTGGPRQANGLEDEANDALQVQAQDRLARAQAIMLLHSAVKGTGSGATPVIAKKLNENLRSNAGEKDKDDVASPALYSSVVLPERDVDYLMSDDGSDVLVGGRKLQNATACLSRLSSEVDVIIPFQNSNLKRAKARVHIEEISAYFDEYIDENQSLVSFLEAFSLSAIPSANDAGIKGAGKFDVFDPINPILDVNPNGYDAAEAPAILFAPAHARTTRSEFTVKGLRRLLETLVQQTLAEFDPKTAWGASLVFYGPESSIDGLRSVCDNHLLRQSIEVFDVGPEVDFTLIPYYITVPSLEDIHLWAGFWNPEMQLIEDCNSHAQKQIEEENEWGDRLKHFQTPLRNLRNNLGRDVFK